MMTPSESGGSGGTRLTLSKRYSAALSSDRQAASVTDSLRESREHDQVGVEPHALNAPDAEEREAVVVLREDLHVHQSQLSGGRVSWSTAGGRSA